MIQRLQSLFLLLAGGFFAGQFFASFASSSESMVGIFKDQMYNLYDNPMLMVIAGLGALVAIIAIFLYNNRPLQTKLSYGVITLSILLPLIAVLIYTNTIENIDNIEVDDELGLYLPIGSIVFGALAVRFIKKDDKLVKSMDRLR